MDLATIGFIAAVLLVLLVISVAGPGGYLVVLTAAKFAVGYVWKLLAPVYVVLRQKSPYKVAALGLAFTNFWVYLYSFVNSGDRGALSAAFDALAATVVGGFTQITTAGWIMISNPGNPIKIIGSIIMIVLGASSIMLWFIGWKMLKKRVPELTYYILVTVLMLALAWGMNDLNAIFEITDLASSVAESAENGTNITVPENVSNETILEKKSPLS